MMSSAPSIDEIKLAYRIPAAWRDLALDGEPGKSVRSPFRKEKNPSFSVFDDGRHWRDFATGEHGDVLDFVARATGTDARGALRWIRERLGFIAENGDDLTNKRKKTSRIPELRFAAPNELAMLNEQRGFGIEALKLAQARGFLRFCDFAAQPAWCITDKRRELFEFRRLDGAPWPAYKHLPERKSHCVGAGKRWPLGAREAEGFSKCALVEGAPDFLALFNFLLAESKEETIAPLAMLGAANARIEPEAIELLRGKHVRLFPHKDAPGQRAACAWARQLTEAGCTVDAFDLSGCICTNGETGKDLADVCRIAPECFEHEIKFRELLP